MKKTQQLRQEIEKKGRNYQKDLKKTHEYEQYFLEKKKELAEIKKY